MNLQSNKGNQVMQKKRVFCYGRVSTDQQNSGLESQCRALSEYCRLNNIVDFEFFTDENQSGAKSSRPALDRMMALVRAGEVDKVIVYSLSRLGRRTTHLLKLMDELSKFNVKFVSLSERIETETPAGRMIFTVLAAVSQLERELIIERVKNGLANARAKGKQIGRKKLRDSEMIRKLLNKGLSYRAVASLCSCSHGSIHAERLAMRKEEKARLELLEKEKQEAEARETGLAPVVFVDLAKEIPSVSQAA